MDAATQTFVLGIAGLVATLISSITGLYFTARARTAPLRELLYAKQVEIAVQLTELIGRVRTYTPIILDPETAHFKEQALTDLQNTVTDFARLSDTAAALLLTELWVEVSQLNRLILNFLVKHDEGEDLSWFPEALAGHAAKTALLARLYLGVDELSGQSASLFTKRKRLDNIVKLQPKEIVDSIIQPASGAVRHKSSPPAGATEGSSPPQ